jgi:ATP-dependent Clp protease adaptor protein ClpS
MAEYVPEGGQSTALESEVELKHPPRFRVFMHNDDYTSMEFVVQVLSTVFGKSTEEAVQIMLAIHKKGIGLCGVFPAQVAESKIVEVHSQARESGFPLRCSMEPE